MRYLYPGAYRTEGFGTSLARQCAMTKNPRVRQAIPTLPFDECELEAPPAASPNPLETGPPARLAVRVGDILQVADTVRLALLLADTATDFLEQRGNMPRTVASLREQIAALRGL